MSSFQKYIISELDIGDDAKTAVARGRILENLMKSIFEQCPGVRHNGSNVLNGAGSAEIDVCFFNTLKDSVLDFLPRIIVLECKNTTSRIGSPDVRVFASKLNEFGLKSGILIATNGITGTPENLRSAHDVIRTAYIKDETFIFLITRSELESLVDIEALVKLLQDKYTMIVMGAKTFGT